MAIWPGVDEGKAAPRSEGKEDEAVPGLVVRPAPIWILTSSFFSSSQKATLPHCLEIISHGLLLMRSHSELIEPVKAKMLTSLFGTVGTALIRPSIFCLFIWSRGAAVSVETPTLSWPQSPPAAPLVGPQGAPKPTERHSPCSVSWVILRVSSS